MSQNVRAQTEMILRKVQELLQQHQPNLSRATGTLPGGALPPGGTTGSGYPPTAHAATHATGGSDPLSPAAIGAATVQALASETTAREQADQTHAQSVATSSSAGHVRPDGTTITISGGTISAVASASTIRGATDYDNTTAPTTSQVIAWNGTKYAPATPSASTIRAATDYDNTTAPTTGQVIAWNGTKYAPTAASGSGGGAPTAANYLTAASNSSLTAAIVIPGLAASADIAGAAGGGISEEYDTTTTGLTWSPTTPGTINSNTTIASALYVRSTTNAEEFGLRAWTPSGAFDARTVIDGGNDGGSGSTNSTDFMITDSTQATRLMLLRELTSTGACNYQAYTYSGGSYTQRGSTFIGYSSRLYCRITRDAGNNISFAYSYTGLPGTWVLMVTVTFVITVAQIGYRINAPAGSGHYLVSDWLRTNV